MTVTIAVTETAPSQDAPLVLPVFFPSVNHPDEPYPVPGSPAPTEIVDDFPQSGEECMEKAKAAGVKVRDFAHEPLPKGRDIRAPEMWLDPVEALVLHDRYIRVSSRRAPNYRLSGKLLHNLRALNWVTQEEAEFHWRPEDWTAMQQYMDRPLGPYPFCIPKVLKKPTAAYRAYMRQERYAPLPDDRPEAEIYVPPDEPGMDDGPQRVDRALLRRASAALYGGSTDGPAPTPARPTTVGTPNRSAPPPKGAHAAKKRRVSAPTPTASGAVTPQTTPSGTPAVGASQTLARDASHPTPPSRVSTPPAANGARPRGRGLARTQTYGRIS
ncbi:hypothetical protein BD413DRAFT_473288 [Trametes elegans]|nr:hypothetical protein BD413DRAFT_473288 [Trametes elegans]